MNRTFVKNCMGCKLTPVSDNPVTNSVGLTPVTNAVTTQARQQLSDFFGSLSEKLSPTKNATDEVDADARSKDEAYQRLKSMGII